MKLLISSNQIKNIRRQQPCNRDQRCKNFTFFFSKINLTKEQLYSQILELRKTFFSRFENIGFEYYLTKTKKSMLEWKLLEMLDKYPEIVHSFDYKRYNHPLFQDVFYIHPDDFY